MTEIDKELVKDSFFTLREIEVYQAYIKNEKNVTKTAKNLGVSPASVSDTINNIKNKLKKAKKTIEIVNLLEMEF